MLHLVPSENNKTLAFVWHVSTRDHQMSRAIDMILEQILNFYSTSLFKWHSPDSERLSIRRYDKRNKVSNFLKCRTCALACLMTHSSIQKNNVLMHCYIEVHWVLFIVFTRTVSTGIFRKALTSIPFTGFCCKKRYVFLKTFLTIVYRDFKKINLTQKKNLTGF